MGVVTLNRIEWYPGLCVLCEHSKALPCRYRQYSRNYLQTKRESKRIVAARRVPFTSNAKKIFDANKCKKLETYLVMQN